MHKVNQFFLNIHDFIVVVGDPQGLFSDCVTRVLNVLYKNIVIFTSNPFISNNLPLYVHQIDIFHCKVFDAYTAISLSLFHILVSSLL